MFCAFGDKMLVGNKYIVIMVLIFLYSPMIDYVSDSIQTPHKSKVEEDRMSDLERR